MFAGFEQSLGCLSLRLFSEIKLYKYIYISISIQKNIYEYIYSDDEYYDYTDEESEDEFLDTIAHRLRNKYEARKYESVTKNTMQTQRRVTEEEALRNARELIEEEELEKKREEKKKAKRKVLFLVARFVAK